MHACYVSHTFCFDFILGWTPLLKQTRRKATSYLSKTLLYIFIHSKGSDTTDLDDFRYIVIDNKSENMAVRETKSHES